MKTNKKNMALTLSLLAGLTASCTAFSKVTPEEAAQLGKNLTCLGAERAGNAAGSIPAFTGEYVDQVPGWNHILYSGDQPVDPFKDEVPVLVLTSSNYKEHAANLTEGQKVLFEKYPDSYKMNIYAGKRIFGVPDYVCQHAQWNALNAELVNDGMGIKGLGQVPFPIPKSGLELLWNHMLIAGPWTQDITRSNASVLPNGSIGWGKTRLRGLSPANNPNELPVSEGVRAFSWNFTMQPQRDAGVSTVSQDYYDWSKQGRLAWSYNPGTRRVRQLPGFGFDQPMIGTNGTMVVDDDRLFNGSPERYEWKNLGKKEIYIPVNAFRVNSGAVKYSDLLTPSHPDPDYLRFELRRVWVLEANLKEGYRHLYSKRVIYLDEDTWAGTLADNYDARGKIWKHAMMNYFQHPDAKLAISGVQFFYDLSSRQYTAYGLTNEERKGPIMNNLKLTADMYTPDALRASGR
ncbi:MAG: DUF1329 domain-containing protein [Pseudomonadales bacterium]|nr:DUF1329 domain-containing protein [Pseudomonadales bacterium]